MTSSQYAYSTVFRLSPLSQSENTHENPFIYESLEVVTYISRILDKNLSEKSFKLDINGDPEFYESGKTGLGSSSALICAIISVFFKHLEILDQRILHFACQLANSRAQKKIGSGFDISCALFGSQIYTIKSSELMKLSLDKVLPNISMSDLQAEIDSET